MQSARANKSETGLHLKKTCVYYSLQEGQQIPRSGSAGITRWQSEGGPAHLTRLQKSSESYTHTIGKLQMAMNLPVVHIVNSIDHYYRGHSALCADCWPAGHTHNSLCITRLCMRVFSGWWHTYTWSYDWAGRDETLHRLQDTSLARSARIASCTAGTAVYLPRRLVH